MIKDKQNEILILSAPLKETIWGSEYFASNLKVTSNPSIGEMWSASGYETNSSIILNGEYKGLPLSEVYKNHKELFANLKEEEFPLLVKLISTKDILSIQVHPDNDYARRVENSLGKSECWLILDKKDDSRLILGNNATSKQELIDMVKREEFDALVNEIDIKIGDFYKIYPGTIHGIGKNILLLEIQQSSDITYRFYDYNRVDKNGNKRELHIKKALDVVNVGKYKEEVINIFENNIKDIEKNEYFIVENIDINDELTINVNNEFLIITSLLDNLEVNDELKIKYAESFIVTSLAKRVKLKGNGKIIISKVNRR